MVDPGKGNAEVVEDIAELLEAKKNVFLNGGAGTGRSELVKQIVKPPDEPASILQCSGSCAALLFTYSSQCLKRVFVVLY